MQDGNSLSLGIRIRIPYWVSLFFMDGLLCNGETIDAFFVV